MLDILRRKPTYTAEQIHTALYLAMMQYIDVMNREITPFVVSDEKKDELAMIKKLDLVNTKNAGILSKEIKAQGTIDGLLKEQKKKLEFMDKIFKHFGNHVLLIGFEDFEALIDKYGLVAGPLSDYIGAVPKKNLEEINKAYDLVKSVREHIYYETGSNHYYNDRDYPFPESIKIVKSIVGYRSERSKKAMGSSELKSVVKRIRRFPILTGDESSTLDIINKYMDNPVEFDKKYGHNDLLSIDSEYTTNLFICAPKSDMKTKVEMKIRAMPEDPFVCSMTRYGIVVHTAWGVEANDEIIKKYEESSKLLQGLKGT